MAPHRDESARTLTSAAGEEPPGGTVRSRAGADRTVVELSGEIDLAVVLATTPQLYALTAAPARRLVADLRPVTFIDCSGLALLVDIRSRVLAGGGTFTLVCADARVLRLLRITGLADVLAPVPTLPGETAEGVPGAEGAEGADGVPPQAGADRARSPQQEAGGVLAGEGADGASHAQGRET
ncbi:anti-sigma factor antagonist [Streptomyces tubbatahanensis]|uniref:Anti-sigma factor antagonist n=1 Tax=Streptomyces tubbatahanensis TaxID=2923272 RepID=A0ABY3XUN0_9ACTN|nr:anti-sigma factor antagonist [Streptomyces tubbatahanensis]UNS97943.1 anti-sigma factor antagonist [Streptomyces tubbatahanensis]